MNLITLILTIAILFGVTDFLTERWPRLQRDIFYIAWFVVTFLFTIKYYYGPDIWAYVPFYENVPSIAQIIAHPDDLSSGFEPGYAIFCRVLKELGVSFYWMTAILSCFYFLIILVLWKKIESKRAFALAILVSLDYNVICYEMRQCLAVIAFLLMVLCLERKSYLWAIVCGVAAIFCHKSGFVAVIPTLGYFLLSSSRVSMRTISQLLLILLVIMFLLPITKLSLEFLNRLPLSDAVLFSINHHLSLGRQVQAVFVVYALTLVCLVHYTQYCKSRKEIFAIGATIGILCIVMLYQYYYLLNRVRSYFTPLIIVYIFNVVQNAEKQERHIPYGQLMKQLTCLILCIYMAHTVVAIHRGGQVLKNRVNDTCTVFDLMGDGSKEAIQRRQITKARKFWEEDYMRHENNKINR